MAIIPSAEEKSHDIIMIILFDEMNFIIQMEIILQMLKRKASRLVVPKSQHSRPPGVESATKSCQVPPTGSHIKDLFLGRTI